MPALTFPMQFAARTPALSSCTWTAQDIETLDEGLMFRSLQQLFNAHSSVELRWDVNDWIFGDPLLGPKGTPRAFSFDATCRWLGLDPVEVRSQVLNFTTAYYPHQIGAHGILSLQGAALDMSQFHTLEDCMLTRRSFLKAASAATAGAMAAVGNTGIASTTDTVRTFVLVHGAWHGGWCWRRVADILTARGNRVFMPSLTGLGDRTHLFSKDISLQTHVEDILSVVES